MTSSTVRRWTLLAGVIVWSILFGVAAAPVRAAEDETAAKAEARKAGEKLLGYVKGEQTGRWESYDSNGNRSNWAEYKDGKRISSGQYKD